MSDGQQRHDMKDEVWKLLEPHLPGQRGQWGGIAEDSQWSILDFANRCPPGGICQLATESGAQFINVFADGETKKFGRSCSKFWLTNQILNGL